METYVGDTVIITLATGVSLVGFATTNIKFKRPDGTHGTWTGALCPGDSTCIKYTTLASDLNIAGDWVVQAYAAGGGTILHGEFAEFTVLNPIPTATTLAPTTVAPTTAP